MPIGPIESPIPVPKIWGGKPLDARTREGGKVSPAAATRAPEGVEEELNGSVAVVSDSEPKPPGVRAYTHFAFNQFTKGRLIDIIAPSS